MSLFHRLLHNWEPHILGLIDSLFLTILIFPAFYFFLFRPFLLHINARKQAEEELRESEERYRSLVSIMTSVIWVTDGEGQFVEPQLEFEKFTGQAWEEHQRGALFVQYPDFVWIKFMCLCLKGQ